MKKAFTLVEMLIVVVVLVTLMTITFKLSSIGTDQSARSATIARMQRLENCLSGYYAAFGSYPPVKLHGSRNIYAKLDESTGSQDAESDAENTDLWNWKEIGENNEVKAWEQVCQACLSQPVAGCFPTSSDDATKRSIAALSNEMKRRAESKDPRYKEYWSTTTAYQKWTAGFSGLGDSTAIGNLEDTDDWRQTKVFQFGVMSFLLPRYLFMLRTDQDTWGRVEDLQQWKNNNTDQYSPFTGDKIAWNVINRVTNGTDSNQKNATTIKYLPSQIVCTRWLANLKNICKYKGRLSLYGVELTGDSTRGRDLSKIFKSKSGGYYILDCITVKDGWGQDFYYYSPRPYQTYTLWSSGANERTFPPWVDRKDLSGTANECISKWTEDDIVRLKN